MELDLALYDQLRPICDIKLDADRKPNGSNVVLGMDVELDVRWLFDVGTEYFRELLAFELDISFGTGRISVGWADARRGRRSRGRAGDDDVDRSRKHVHHPA